MAQVVFYDKQHFSRSVQPYSFLPFRFIDLDDRRLVVNEVGEYCLLDRPTFDALVSRRLTPADAVYSDLKSKHIIYDTNAELPIRLLATKYRTKRSFLAGFTRLHIFVVSLRCDHSCQYCQVSRVSADKHKYDMSTASAVKALDLVFRSPATEIKIEFQGGEPLLNFELIRFIVLEAGRRNEDAKKDIEFVVTTNLAFVDDEMLAFFREHRVLISTSLDGPESLHNANRPRPGGDSYERAIAGIARARQTVGHDCVAALMTTTRRSLEYPIQIVDEYVRQGFDSIFLRPISPYGFAVKTHLKTGYDRDEFLTFYKTALDHVIELNKRGTYFIESYAQLLLRKIFTPFSTGYVDLQSPAGAGIGVVVYNYDGDVYATDEARMLAEMGDTSFRLGNVHTSTYEEIFGGETVRTLVAASCVESLPGCADCAFQTYCGCEPIENHAVQGSIFGHRPTSDFCRRNMEIIRHLFRLYHGGDEFVQTLFWAWIQNCRPSDLVPNINEAPTCDFMQEVDPPALTTQSSGA